MRTSAGFSYEDSRPLVTGLLPITALTVVRNYVIAGKGSCVFIYNHDEASLLESHKVFRSQQIHGIVATETDAVNAWILVWGKRKFRILQISLNACQEHGKSTTICTAVSKAIRLNDWILDASFKPHERDQPNPVSTLVAAALVTAHNAVFTVCVELGLSEQKAHNTPALHVSDVRQVVPASRRISYSAHILWVTPSNILLALGSAFGEVIYSEYTVTTTSAVSLSCTTFLGHEGSIFGVRISEPVVLYQGALPQRILASCSDDRTIRLWDVSEGCLNHNQGHQRPDLSNHQRGQTELATDRQGYASTVALAVVMGHLSRIWGIRYVHSSLLDLGFGNGSVLGLVSLGEDGTCQLWSLRSVPQSKSYHAPHFSYEISHRETFKSHTGKNIWSSIVASTARKGATDALRIITGGADGGIVSLYMPLGQHTSNDGLLPSQHEAWDLKDVAAATALSSGFPNHVDLNTGPYTCIRAYGFLGNNHIALATDGGDIFLAEPGSTQTPHTASESRRWRLLATIPDLRGYSIACGLACCDLLFFGGNSGRVVLVTSENDGVMEVGCTESKVTGLFAEVLNYTGGVFVSLVVSQLSPHPPFLYVLRRSFSSWRVVCATPLHCTIDLQDSIITSAVCGIDRSMMYCLIGTRLGTLIALYIPKTSIFSESRTTTPDAADIIWDAVAVQGVHGKDTVTSLSMSPASELTPYIHIFSTGRDGTLVVHRFKEQTTIMRKVHQLTWPYGANIERLFVDTQTSEILIAGFSNTRFLLYDVIHSREVFSFECGGCHRTWAFSVRRFGESNTLGGTLIWTKKAMCNIQTVYQPRQHVLRAGGHGREVKAADLTNSSTVIATPLIATGAEDTDIRIFSYESNPTTNQAGFEAPFVCRAILRKHKTGIQCLKWSSDASFLFSSGGCEEFYVWRVVGVPHLGIGVVCAAAYPTESQDSDIRITSFCIHDLHTLADSGVSEDGRSFVIALTLSNSVLKIVQLRIDCISHEWTLLATAQYTSSCLTQSAFMLVDDHFFLVTTSTDGHAVAWKLDTILPGPRATHHEVRLPPQLQPIRIVRMHQSAVKAMAMAQISNTMVLLLTGGDDNSISLVLFKYAKHTVQLETSGVTTVADAHAASVTASVLLCHEDLRPKALEARSRCTLKAFTSSNDQRLKQWEVDIVDPDTACNNVLLTFAGDTCTAVADVSELTCLSTSDPQTGRTKLLCAGVGMEVLEV